MNCPLSNNLAEGRLRNDREKASWNALRLSNSWQCIASTQYTNQLQIRIYMGFRESSYCQTAAKFNHHQHSKQRPVQYVTTIRPFPNIMNGSLRLSPSITLHTLPEVHNDIIDISD